MNENLMSLTRLLATDDEFNQAFSSAATEEEKYSLSKSKFDELTREDFSEFMKQLREAQKKSFAELSPDEMVQISGGAGNLVTKLAATAMFVTALGMTTAQTGNSKTAEATRINNTLGENEKNTETTILQQKMNQPTFNKIMRNYERIKENQWEKTEFLAKISESTCRNLTPNLYDGIPPEIQQRDYKEFYKSHWANFGQTYFDTLKKLHTGKAKKTDLIETEREIELGKKISKPIKKRNGRYDEKPFTGEELADYLSIKARALASGHLNLYERYQAVKKIKKLDNPESLLEQKKKYASGLTKKVRQKDNSYKIENKNNILHLIKQRSRTGLIKDIDTNTIDKTNFPYMKNKYELRLVPINRDGKKLYYLSEGNSSYYDENLNLKIDAETTFATLCKTVKKLLNGQSMPKTEMKLNAIVELIENIKAVKTDGDEIMLDRAPMEILQAITCCNLAKDGTSLDCYDDITNRHTNTGDLHSMLYGIPTDSGAGMHRHDGLALFAGTQMLNAFIPNESYNYIKYRICKSNPKLKNMEENSQWLKNFTFKSTCYSRSQNELLIKYEPNAENCFTIGLATDEADGSKGTVVKGLFRRTASALDINTYQMSASILLRVIASYLDSRDHLLNLSYDLREYPDEYYDRKSQKWVYNFCDIETGKRINDTEFNEVLSDKAREIGITDNVITTLEGFYKGYKAEKKNLKSTFNKLYQEVNSTLGLGDEGKYYDSLGQISNRNDRILLSKVLSLFEVLGCTEDFNVSCGVWKTLTREDGTPIRLKFYTVKVSVDGNKMTMPIFENGKLKSSYPVYNDGNPYGINKWRNDSGNNSKKVQYENPDSDDRILMQYLKSDNKEILSQFKTTMYKSLPEKFKKLAMNREARDGRWYPVSTKDLFPKRLEKLQGKIGSFGLRYDNLPTIVDHLTLNENNTNKNGNALDTAVRELKKVALLNDEDLEKIEHEGSVDKLFDYIAKKVSANADMNYLKEIRKHIREYFIGIFKDVIASRNTARQYIDDDTLFKIVCGQWSNEGEDDYIGNGNCVSSTALVLKSIITLINGEDAEIPENGKTAGGTVIFQDAIRTLINFQRNPGEVGEIYMHNADVNDRKKLITVFPPDWGPSQICSIIQVMMTEVEKGEDGKRAIDLTDGKHKLVLVTKYDEYKRETVESLTIEEKNK